MTVSMTTNKKVNKIAVVQTGGCSAVINSTLAGIVENAKASGLTIYGLLNGFEGLLNNKIIDLSVLTKEQIDKLRNTPAMFLGSSRMFLTKEIFKAIPQKLNELGIDALIMIGENGLLNKMKEGSVYIDVSTIDPQTAQELEDFAAARGIGFMGCPLGKGPAQAEKAEQPIFAGGKKETFEKVKEILEIVGSPVYYMGGATQAYAFKLISNMVGMTNLAVLSEGMRLCEKAGIEGNLFQKLLAETGADSAQLHMRGPLMLANDYANRFGVKLALKDVRLGCEMGDAWGYSAEFTKLAKSYFEKADNEGYGMEDCVAVYKVIK